MGHSMLHLKLQLKFHFREHIWQSNQEVTLEGAPKCISGFYKDAQERAFEVALKGGIEDVF